MARALVVLVVVALLVGCQQAPPPGGGTGSVHSVLAELREEGDTLAARGEYAAAVARYEAVLQRDPDDLSLRYALGVALSHLGRQPETIDAFRWVVERGQPEWPEVRTAHRWLVNAGVLAEAVAFAATLAPGPEAERAEVASPRSAAPIPSAIGTVKGRTEARTGIRQVVLALAGDEDRNREIAFSKIVKPGEAFEFRNVPPGTYRLTAEDPDGDGEIWSAELTVAPGHNLLVDLK